MVTPTPACYVKASRLVLVSKAHYGTSPFIVQMSYFTAQYVNFLTRPEFLNISQKALGISALGHAIHLPLPQDVPLLSSHQSKSTFKVADLS